jgi:hypothetical protein
VFQIVEEKCGRRRRRSDAEDAEKTRKKGSLRLLAGYFGLKRSKYLVTLILSLHHSHPRNSYARSS